MGILLKSCMAKSLIATATIATNATIATIATVETIATIAPDDNPTTLQNIFA
jgi:hypothetical protein